MKTYAQNSNFSANIKPRFVLLEILKICMDPDFLGSFKANKLTMKKLNNFAEHNVI